MTQCATLAIALDGLWHSTCACASMSQHAESNVVDAYAKAIPRNDRQFAGAARWARNRSWAGPFVP